MYDRARSDNARILSSSSGFSVPVVFHSATGVDYTTRAFFIDVSLDVNPQTGLAAIGRRCALTTSYKNENGNTVIGETIGAGWTVTITAPDGTSAKWKIADPMPDRTFGSVTMTVKRITETVV